MVVTSSSQVVVVTGASSGIGLLTAKLFASRGDRVVLVARSAERLAALRTELEAAGHEALALPTDLSQVSQAPAVVAAATSAFGRLDVLVNNAGYGKQTRFEEMDDEDVRRMFAVNVLSPMALARAAVEVMRRQGGGSIVNVASVGGVVAHPLNVAYCASKHALVGFSKSLRLELVGTGVRVTAVCPAATRTAFFERARGEIPFDRMIQRGAVEPGQVARAIVRASSGNRALLFPSWGARLLYLADKWLPAASAAGNVRYRDSVLRPAGGYDSRWYGEFEPRGADRSPAPDGEPPTRHPRG